MTLSLYIASRFIFQFLRVVLVVGIFIYSIDILGFISSNRFNLSWLDIMYWAGLRMHHIMSLMMPILCMLAALAFTISLARRNEFVITRAAGQSMLYTLMPVAFISLIFGLISVFFYDPFAQRMIKKYNDLDNNVTFEENQSSLYNKNGYWLRQVTPQGHDVIKALSIAEQGKILRDVTIYSYDMSQKISHRIFAKTAFFVENEWVLFNGIKWDDALMITTPEEASQKFQILRISTTIMPKDLSHGYPDPNLLSPFKIREQIAVIEKAGFDVQRYKAHQVAQYARPFLFALMTLIGCVFCLHSSRNGGLGVRVVFTLALGFLTYFINNLAMILGETGAIVLWIANFSPILASGLVVTSLFLHYEDG